MKIIIVGAGDVGFHLAKLLTYESQDIYLIDSDSAKLQYAESHIDVKTIHGDAATLEILKEANISNADLLITVTESQNSNFIISILGKKLGAKKTIARVDNIEIIKEKKELGLEELGIDYLISPELLAAKEIKLLVQNSVFNDSFEFEEGKLTVCGVILDHKSPALNKSVRQTAIDHEAYRINAIAIRRKNSMDTIIPRGDTILKKNDQIYFATTQEGINEIYTITGKEPIDYKNILILGGGRIGIKVAQLLSRKGGYNVKLIEEDKAKAFEAADILYDTLVIHGDGRDVELLEEEHIREMDVCIAVTGNSETNIMSCLVAKSRGVKRTIALVENIDYIKVSQNLGIDTLVNKKLLAASSIFRHIRKGNVVALANLHNIDAEVLEIEAHTNSKITKKPIKDLKLPKDSIIAGYVRNGDAHIANGKTKLEAGDKVLVFTAPHELSKVESFFK